LVCLLFLFVLFVSYVFFCLWFVVNYLFLFCCFRYAVFVVVLVVCLVVLLGVVVGVVIVYCLSLFIILCVLRFAIVVCAIV